MTNRRNTSANRITIGAVLLALAATASGCGMALPTQPAVDAGVVAQKSTATTSLGEPSTTTIDDSAPGGGPGVEPPAPEEIIPTPGPTYNGQKIGWWFNAHRRHNK